jgi:peptidylprolyl isomerase
VRFRPLATLSVAAAAVLLMAGCSSTAPDATDTASAGTDLCASAAASGAASDGVTVEGEFGAMSTATFTAPLEVGELERTVVTEGDGDQLAEGDYISYGLTAFDAATGEQLGSAGYEGNALQPQQVVAGGPLGQLFGCAPVGSRLVATLPASDQGGAQVYVLDVLSATPGEEWCAPGDFTGEAPTVTFGDGGRPTVTIPQTELPEDVSIEVLEEGDGDVVAPGDTVEVNYEGVKWSDGTVFDSSWERGETASFATDGVVDGFRVALEGQKVGSTVLVAMPPACGYGVAGSSDNELSGETLVFVVEIIGTAETQG